MEEKVYFKKIYFLLLLGGLLVAADFFVVHFVFAPTSWGAWWSANVFHLLGGFYAFFFIRAVFAYTRSLHKTSAESWMESLIFILGAVFLGVMWEWFELAIDRYHALVQSRQSVMSYADNIGDLATDTLGALLAAFYTRRR